MESFGTSTIIRANGVVAECINTAIVHIVFALINILTRHAIPVESFKTSTIIRANGVIAECMDTAIVHITFAFINILT